MEQTFLMNRRHQVDGGLFLAQAFFCTVVDRRAIFYDRRVFYPATDQVAFLRGPEPRY
jgi:hypothetical protein